MPHSRGTLILAVVAINLIRAPQLYAQWSDVTPGAMGQTGGSGVSWGDFDNDGDQDFYLTRWGQPNKLFRNDGANQFTDVAIGSVLADSSHSRAAPWADIDNDGDLDLFLANEGDPNKLFRNDGDQGFADATGGTLGVDHQDVGAGVPPGSVVDVLGFRLEVECLLGFGNPGYSRS
jgi:hypothetical protein